MPLDFYRTSPSEIAAISQAVIILANRCRQRFGFAATLQPYRALHPVDEMARRYSRVRDVPTAKRNGYHPVLPPVPVDTQPPMASAAEELVTSGLGGPKDFNVAPVQKVNGLAIPPGGCLSDASRQLGATSNYNGIAEELQTPAFNHVEADPRTLALNRQWSRCMLAAGYKAEDPRNVGEQFGIAGPPSGAEVQQSLVDVACQEKFNLYYRMQELEIQAQRAIIEENQQQLQREHAERQKVLRNAAKVLAVPAIAH